MHKNLTSWLSYIERLHPKTIVMGLDRVNVLISRLQLKPRFKIVTVAGTNGKGSTTAMLEKIYRQAGYQVGCYTSPHLLRYNERLRINQQEISDEALCKAFSAVEASRTAFNPPVELTYFEFGTLAAIWHLMQINIDVAILEIGLGGRLDAVNAFEPDCAIVTNVDLDHQEYLGDTREKIGFEKAGVYRPLIPAICGDANPPESLLNYAKNINANFFNISLDFVISQHATYWQYQLNKNNGSMVNYKLPYPALIGDYQLQNAACAITAIEMLQEGLPVKSEDIAQALQSVFLSGRFEMMHVPVKNGLATVIFDVAHNPHAASALQENLIKIKHEKPASIIAVFAMLSDKDIIAVVQALSHVIDVWYVADINQPRGAKAADIAVIIRQCSPAAEVKCFSEAALAFQEALNENQFYKADNENDKIVVFGSFYTVASVKAWLSSQH